MYTRHLIFALTVALLFAACEKPKLKDALPSGSQVLALGDSLTEGAGVSPEQAWPALLAHRTGWIVTNGGVSGDTSADGLRRLPALLERSDPALVLVTLGGNDMLRRIPPQQTIDNLEQIFGLIKAHGAKLVLLATPQPSVAGAVFQTLSPPDFYHELAEQHGIPLIEDAISDVLSDPRLKGDPLHPSAEGHEQLSEYILEELKAIGYAR